MTESSPDECLPFPDPYEVSLDCEITDNKELLEWLGTAPGVSLGAVLSLSNVPSLIGGIKSGKFIVKEPEASPDAPPDLSAVVDLDKVAGTTQELAGFFDFAEATERQAERQYPEALFEVQQLLAEAHNRGASIERLFVPDAVNGSSWDYFRRLGRLAQDTGVSVVIKLTQKYGDPFFVQFDPPTAESVEDYWAARGEQIGQNIPETLPSGPSDSVAMEALLSLGPEPPYDDQEAVWRLVRNLEIVADASPAKLRDWLLDSGAASHMLGTIKELGYGTGYAQKRNRARARLILAKIGDQDGLASLANELRERNGGYGNKNLLAKPLGVYLRDDPDLLASTMRRIDRLIAGCPEDKGELSHLLGAVYHTNDPRISEFVSRHLEVPATAGDYYAGAVLMSALRWLPGFIDILQAAPESEQRRASLEIIERRVASFLDGMVGGHLEHVKKTHWRHGSSLVGDMLLKFRNPAHQELLRRHMLKLFEETGSILEPASPGDSDAFSRQYLKYREFYGDIPEISQHIKITGRP